VEIEVTAAAIFFIGTLWIGPMLKAGVNYDRSRQ
jgi:hypothetical protein